ncbi:MAG TPA: family 10 glycosylhydrolase [Paludibacteraceae bacterium]|nr:family 10 glycosylhydrolase [Paludibacteraceae bacterium]HOS37044.1 family 10 glycosylhydrolase [Paludibacteraceae bacterium]HPK19949.1 family 10 glycosylhydrolase [Paludibacteraceae bacterium]
MKTQKLTSIRYFFIALIGLLMPFLLTAQPKREVRSTWMTTAWNNDWPSEKGTTSTTQTAQKNELIGYLDGLKTNNFNALYLQIRPMADAFYPSSYEPWSSYVSNSRGTSPEWDPLKFAIEECHKRGMEFHAWINPFRFGNATTETSTPPFNTPRDTAVHSWLIYHWNDTKKTTYFIFNPALTQVKNRILDITTEIVSNYDVDGIIWDDYFYPEGINASQDAAQYTAYTNGGGTLSLKDWRRKNVNDIVAATYNRIQQLKPWVKFGISPAGAGHAPAAQYGLTGPNCSASDWQYDGIFSEPLAWLNSGTIDYISPQCYWLTTHNTNPFGPLTGWWTRVAKHFGRHHYASHSISFFYGANNSTSWAEVGVQLQQSRDSATLENTHPGEVFYASRDMTGKRLSGFMPWLKTNKYQNPSLTPAIDWKNHAQLLTPTNVTVSDTSLTWQYGGTTWTTFNGNTSKSVRFAIYCYPKNTNSEDAMANSANLLGVSYITSFTLPSTYNSNYTYAVRAMDRYGNEFGTGYYNANTSYTLPDETVSFNTTAVWTETAGGSSYVATDNSQRSIAVWKGTLFIPSTNGTISLVNAKTGTLRRTLTLSGVSRYPLFCLRITDEGEVLVGNSNLETTKLYIYRCDTITGNCTLFQEITTGTTNSRFDYFDVYGNLTQGMLVAASNNGYTLTAPIANGDIIGANVVTYSGSHNGGVSTTAIKRDDNSFFVAGFSTNAHKKYTIVDASTLSTISFGSVGPSTTLASVGGCCFRFKGHEFYAAAESRFGAFKVFDISAGVDDAYLIGDVTTALDSTTNGTCVTPLCVELCDSDNEAWIYVLAPNNGIAAYKLSITNSPVQTLPVQNITGTGATFYGRTAAGTSLFSEVGFEYKKLTDSEYTRVTATTSNDFNKVVSSLTANTFYLVRAYIKTTGGNYKYGEVIKFKTTIVPPTVTTGNATDITTTTAILHGAATKGTLSMTETGFAWKVSGGTYAKQAVALSSDTLTYTLTGLALGTTYYVKAYATTANGDTYGSEVSFTTVAVVPPTVTTSAATNVSYTTVTLNGLITKGDNPITDKGFEWKKASAADYTNVSKDSGAGTISENLSNLQPATEYTYRAYGTASDGTVYGENKTFTTLTVVPPTVTTSDTTNTSVSYTTATLSGTITKGSYDITAKGFEYKKSGTTEWTSIAGTLSDTALSANITGLHHNTTYMFRAFATTSTDATTVYGAEKTLTTHYRQLIIGNGETKALSTPFGGDIKFYHGGQIDNTIDNTIEVTGVVQYVQSFTRNLWYTIIFPFDVTKVTYGKNQEILPYRNGSGKFLLKQHNDNTSMNFIERWEDTPTPPAGIIIAKNVPYIIQVQSLVLNNREITFHSANSTHSIGNKTFVLYDNGNTTAFNYFGNNTLRPQTIGTCYIIEDQLFRRQDGTTSVPAFECYVQATPTVMKSMPYIGIMKEAGGTTETANTLYPYTLQTWSDNANVYIRSTVDQDIAIYNINGACLRKISLEKGETVSLQLPNAIYLLIGSQCEKPFKIVF